MSEKKYIIDDENLMSEWDWDTNNLEHLNPNNISLGSNKISWWKCNACGNKWKASIHNRNKGTGCPICSKSILSDKKNKSLLLKKGSLFDKLPDLSSEWDYHKNASLTPKDVTCGSGKKVWWICSHGHSWSARIDHRVNGSGCVYCTNQKAIQGENDFATLYPNILTEWDYEKNKGINPADYKSNSNKKVWWICSLGHSWETTISHRTSGTRCPKCYKEYGTSFAEQCICYYLSQYTKVENRIKIDNFEVDIYLSDYNIGFEYDGIRYHSSERSKTNDDIKDKFFNNSKIKLYRIKESDKNEFDKNNRIIYCIPDYNYEYIKYILNQIEQIVDFKISSIDINNDSVKVYNQYIKSIKENSLAKTNKRLSQEWDYEKNGNILPENFTSGSNKKVWWICSKCNSSYLATIGHRSVGTSCPYCSGKKINETNSLKYIFPNLLNMWDYKNNDTISPENVHFNSRKKVWWICPTCKKSYIRAICLMTKSKTFSCKDCMHKIIGSKNQQLATIKNGTLKDTHPDLVIEWHYKKNKEISPDLVSANSGKKVWWICKNCNEEWEATIYNRTNGTGCPKCKNHRKCN